MQDRLAKLIEKLPFYENDEKVDAALITSPINRLYFSGFKSTDGIIFVTREES